MRNVLPCRRNDDDNSDLIERVELDSWKYYKPTPNKPRGNILILTAIILKRVKSAVLCSIFSIFGFLDLMAAEIHMASL